MPFRHVAPDQFDLDALKLMQQAFDTACARLAIDESDSRRVALANEIIRLVTEDKHMLLAELAEEALARVIPSIKTGP
jgi:hypothetical protein